MAQVKRQARHQMGGGETGLVLCLVFWPGWASSFNICSGSPTAFQSTIPCRLSTSWCLGGCRPHPRSVGPDDTSAWPLRRARACFLLTPTHSSPAELSVFWGWGFFACFWFQCCGDEKWGDWRPHLAMILSNLSNSVDVESRAMATMGDTLGRSGWTRKRGLGLGAPARDWPPVRGPCGPGSAVLSWSPSPPAFSPLSLQRAPRCCTLLLPHGPGRICS